jgi:hypothetical protein
MTLIDDDTRLRLARRLADHGANRLQSTYPDWAQAMRAEAEWTGAEPDSLRWAAGTAMAGYRVGPAARAGVYAIGLMAGMALMAAYQWSMDESLWTLAAIGLIAGVLGALRPDRCVTSGIAVGSVVGLVTAFEAITGVLPTYETYHGLAHSLVFAVLLPPGLAAAALGRLARRGFEAIGVLG